MSDCRRYAIDSLPPMLRRVADRLEVVIRDGARLGDAAATLTRITGARPDIDPDRRRLRVPLPRDRVETLTVTVRALQEAGIEVADIGLHRPTLDEALRHLTARHATGRPGSSTSSSPPPPAALPPLPSTPTPHSPSTPPASPASSPSSSSSEVVA